MPETGSKSEGPRFWDPEWNIAAANFKEMLATRARFKGTYDGSPDLLTLVENAAFYDETFSLEDWNRLAKSYPREPLIKGQLTKTPHEDCPARAYHLSKAIKRLLELVDAPEAMKSDVDLILSTYVPRGAKKSAEVQRAMISKIGTPVSEIAKTAAADPGTVHELVSRRIVIRPKSKTK